MSVDFKPIISAEKNLAKEISYFCDTAVDEGLTIAADNIHDAVIRLESVMNLQQAPDKMLVSIERLKALAKQFYVECESSDIHRSIHEIFDFINSINKTVEKSKGSDRLVKSVLQLILAAEALDQQNRSEKIPTEVFSILQNINEEMFEVRKVIVECGGELAKESECTESEESESETEEQ